MFKKFKYRLLEWKWERILKNSGHTSWYGYFRYNDPDYNIRGRTITKILHGYTYITCVRRASVTHYYQLLTSANRNEGSEVYDWCNRYCRGKFCGVCERVTLEPNGDYLLNDIVGSDELFFGFKDHRDYLLFELKWG